MFCIKIPQLPHCWRIVRVEQQGAAPGCLGRRIIAYPSVGVPKPIEGDPILGIERDGLAKILDRGLWPLAAELEQSDLAVQLPDVRKGINGHELTVRCHGVIRVASPE